MAIGKKTARAVASEIVTFCKTGNTARLREFGIKDDCVPELLSRTALPAHELAALVRETAELRVVDDVLGAKLSALAAENGVVLECVYQMRRGLPRQMLIELGGFSRRTWDAAREYCDKVGVTYAVQRGREPEPCQETLALVADSTVGVDVTLDTLVDIATSNRVPVLSTWIAYKRIRQRSA